MAGKEAEDDYYDDEFESMAAEPSPAKVTPVPSAQQATTAAAQPMSLGRQPAAASSGHSTQLFSGHSNAQQWEDVNYEDVILGKKLGGGGFAIVYSGTWKGKSVALKTLVCAASLSCFFGCTLQIVCVQFDPTVDDALKTEFMDELHVMR
jgi:hypothetical protein